MMKKLVCVVLLVAGVAMLDGCGLLSGKGSGGKGSGDKGWPHQIAGSYKGNILTGQTVWPGVTTFAVADDGAITGTYELDENGPAVTGELSDFRETGPLQLACKWKDKSGVGDFTLKFAEDLKSFKGSWSNDADENKTKNDWGGEK